MLKDGNRISQIFFLLLLCLISLSFVKPTAAAGQCGTQDDRHYLNVHFYDENGNLWATSAPDSGNQIELAGCRPPPERAPVQVGRPDLPDTPMDNWVDSGGNWRRWICDNNNKATAQIRTYRCDSLPPNEFVYIDVWTYPPYDPNLTEWTYIDTGDGETFSGVGPRVTIPNSDLQSRESRRYLLEVQMVLATTDIWGLKLKMPNNYTHSSTDGQTVTLANGAATVATTTTNPYYFMDLDPQPAYTVSVTQPAVNYSVGYSYCFNQVAPGCPHTPIALGNSFTFNSPAGGYTDLWWHYWEYIGWYRLKQASFTKQGGPLVNFIPPNVVPYDGYDTDEELLNIKPAAEPDGIGLITSTNAIDIGPITSNVSNKNWAKTNYVADKGYLSNLSSFLAYARARKEIKVITNINDLESNKINIFQGNLTLQNNTINPSRDNMVLIVQGNLTIQSAPGGNFNQARRSWGFIVTGNINVNPSINEMNGVFIANNYDLAYGAASSTTALKVVGNLISNTPLSNIKRYRPVADYQRASLYIVFFPEYYYDLVPYLSTITQEGRQLE